MMFEVIIKDNSFLPETVDIKTNTEVSFQNEDGVQHKIHCKGSFNFPSLTIDAGGSKRYKFANPGKYLISDISHGDAKCVIEATEEVEQENKPKQNYFPLSSEKKAGGKVGTNKQVISERVVENDSPIFHSSPRHPSFIEEGTFSVQQVDEYRKKGAKFTFSSRKHKGGESSGNSSGGSSDSSGEFGSLTQQRTKLKQPTSDFYVNGGGRGDNFHWDDSSRREVNRIHHGSGAMCPQSPSQQASPNVATPSIEFETVEVEVGQEVEFRLSGPAHAEHELWGTSTLIALTFESPLLQRDECASFVFCPPVPGEIHVVCKIFDDMTCRIVVVAPVHGRSEASPSRRGTEAETATGTVERAAPVIVREGLPSFEIPPPQATPQAAAPRFPSQFLSCGQATPAQPLSPSSPAIQDVRTALLQLDNSRAAGGGSGGKDEGGGGGGGGEGGGYVSESQSSFYDSDDVFSDFEAPVNLQATYASLTPNRKKNLEGGAPKREVRAHAERPPAVADTALLSGRRPVSHLVSLEELYNFRPSQLVIRSGDCVRFRRSAALSVLNLSCAGEFSDSAVNTPCTLSVYLVPGDPLAEEQYFCFDHVFRHAGEFEVQNEIFSFNKCCVTVLRENDPKPNDDVKNYRSGVGNTHSKPSAAPKLRGSFSGPALPVFYKPIEGAAKAPRAEEAESCSGVGAKRPICAGSASPFRAPPTTTIVNASTTTVCSTATPATCGSSVLPALFTSPPSLLGLTETPTSRSSPRTTPTPTNRANRLSPMPLFGSFSSRTSHTTTCSSSPANTAPAFDDAAISAVVEAIAQAENDEPTDDEEGSGGCGAAEDPAARKKREKARKKREKLKLKKKMKKLAEEEELANDELQPLLGEDVGYDEISAARRTPEAVIRNYLNDSSRSHAFYAAQADYGEEFPDSDQEPPGHDHASGPTTSVEPDDPVGGSPESATSADMATKRKRTRPRSKSSGKLNRSVSTEGTQTADADASDEAGSQSTVVEQSHPQQHDASVDASPSPPTSSPTIAVDLGIQEPLFVVPDVVGGSTEKTPQPQKTVTVDMPETTTAITAPDTVTKRKRGKPRSKSSAKLDNAGLVDDLPQAANAGDGSFNPEATASIAITSESAQKVQTLPPQQQQPALAVVDASPASPLLPPAVEEPATVAFSDLQAAAGILLPPASSEPVASSDFVTPVKHRRRRESASEQPGVPATDGPAEELFCTPPSRMPPSAATSTSAAAALLKAALQISPQNKNSDPPDNQHREMDTPNSQLFTTPGQFTPAFTRTQIPAENAAVFPSTQRQERSPPSTPASTTAKEDTRLSMLVAYEQQMEEFLMSRFETIQTMMDRGIYDRLPSGKQVEILGNLCDGPDEVFDSVDTVNAGASKKRRKSAAQSAVPPPQKSVVPAVAAGTAPATPGTKTKPKATSNGPQQPASSSKSPSQGSSAKTAKSVHPAPNGSGHNKRK